MARIELRINIPLFAPHRGSLRNFARRSGNSQPFLAVTTPIYGEPLEAECQDGRLPTRSDTPIGPTMATRGEHLVRADRRFATGAGVIGRIAAPAFKRVLGHLHDRLETGGIEASLPDGRERRIGFHRPGPVAVVAIHSWLALVRLATSGSVGWYKAWVAGEWSSPDPVPLFELFMRNGRSLGEIGRAKGVRRRINALAHRLRDNGIGQAKENIAAHYDLGNDFYSEWLDPGMTYSSARFAPGDKLERAQLRKIELLLDRLEVKPGDEVELAIGDRADTVRVGARLWPNADPDQSVEAWFNWLEVAGTD